MRVKQPFTCRRSRSAKRWAAAMTIAMTLSPIGRPVFQPTVHAQTVASPSQGFHITADDLRFIFRQIQVGQAHAGGTPLSSLVSDPQLPLGLRTVDGSFNNLVPGQTNFGQADLVFPRLLTPVFKDLQDDAAAIPPTNTYASVTPGNLVIDAEPRVATNLIADQTAGNPAAVAAASNPCGAGGFVCSPPDTLADVTDPDSGSLFIPNITPDFGLSAPFNLMFTFFGQFFDHGLDLVTKGGGTVKIPLRTDDPLFVAGGPNAMFVTRGTVFATPTDPHGSQNTTTPWVDQNQTYTSHPSHQVFLREYQMVAGKPAQTGLVLDGGHCAPRGTGIPGDQICNIGNWADVKNQARTMLGIQLVDTDIFDVPKLVTDPYGHFKPGPNGFAQMMLTGGGTLEGNPAANSGQGVPVPANVVHTGHAFLNDIAHNAVPVGQDANGNPIVLSPDGDATICDFRQTPSCQPAGTYDDELLNAHMVTGDGRGNENIALTMVHQLFHAEHNRLRYNIDQQINALLTPGEIAAWRAVDTASGWDYNERLFQAARLVTEMQYQHLVFEEFARSIQPLINPFLGGLTSINPAISAEFAHTVYRLGHSMLPERVARINAGGGDNGIRLLDAFLAPQKYNESAPGVNNLTADKAAGAIVRGLSQEVGNELDEFVTESVRNQLLGLPLDLPAINLARGRSEGIPSLNEARRQFFAATKDAALKPYLHWQEFGNNLKHPESLINFIAVYGTHASITGTLAQRRNAAANLVLANDPFLRSTASTSGLNNVDFWIGGMAERQAVFGGLLGSTFNFVFERQLEKLQDGDRFYYLQRLDGENLVTQLEGNSFAELIRRNTDFTGGMDVIFKTADINFSFNDAVLLNSTTAAAAPICAPGTPPANCTLGSPANEDGMRIITMEDGTKQFFDPTHKGRNIVFNGNDAPSPVGDDRFMSDIGDDTLYGNGGNDRLDGFEGNDTIHGGAGDDTVFGGNGDDVLKGGGGNDALSSGPGFGADLIIAGDGNDFMLCADDGCEHFAGPGNDIIVDGAMRAEAIHGGEGDDWLDDGEGHDGGMFGDGGNVFDLLAGLSPVGGDDVLGSGPGQDNHFGEGGDDIMLMSEGSNKFLGDYGFDWITLRGWLLPEFIELALLADPNAPLNFNDTRNKYRFVDGASGWTLNDHIAGSNKVLCEPPGEVAECLIVGMELTQAGADKITGLSDLMGPDGFDKPLDDPAVPGVKGVGFMGGDILLGGPGSDVLEGKKGDDLIDGDLWLNVQLRAVMDDDSVQLVDSPRSLVENIFADPNDPDAPVHLSPGNISIVKSIVTPDPATVVPADCPASAADPVGLALNCDTAVFAFPLADYSIVINDNGSVTVTHIPARAADVPASDGSDTLRNIERLQFADTRINTPKPLNTVPGVVGLTLAEATARIQGAGLRVGTVTTATSTTIHINRVALVSPQAGTTLPASSLVNLVISTGTIVPLVVGLPEGAVGTHATALNALDEAGLVAGTITRVANAAAAGIVIAQGTADGTAVDVGTAVNLTVSTGPPPVNVPNVVGSTQAAATTTLTNNFLVVGTVTFQASTSIAAGSVISTSPSSGTSVPRGTAVNLVISQGTAPTIATVVTRNLTSPNTSVTSPAFAVAANTLVVAFFAADGPASGTNTNVNSINNSGTLLSWTRAGKAATQRGDAEVWWAFVPAARASLTVTAVTNFSEPSMLTVVGFTGAQNTMVGAATLIANAAVNTNRIPSASLTTTKPNSWVFGVGVDWDNPRVMTAGANQTIVSQFAPSVGDTYWVSRTTNPVVTPGATTLSVTYPGTTHNDRWNLALVEIRQK